MASTPEVPFILNRWKRFTPTFQTSGGDASIGADGIAAGSFWIVGHTMIVLVNFTLAGAGASPGSGSLLIPLPTGYSLASIDETRMPLTEQGEGEVEVAVPVLALTVLDGTQASAWGTLELNVTEDDDRTGAIDVDGFATLADGDNLQLRFEVALKEPALPG